MQIQIINSPLAGVIRSVLLKDLSVPREDSPGILIYNKADLFPPLVNNKSEFLQCKYAQIMMEIIQTVV